MLSRTTRSRRDRVAPSSPVYKHYAELPNPVPPPQAAVTRPTPNLLFMSILHQDNSTGQINPGTEYILTLLY